MRIIPVSALALFVFAACASRPRTIAPAPAPTQSDKSEMKLVSSAFKEGETIPRQYTCDGINISPPLEWSDVPKTAKTIALIADDPDASSGAWAHWVFYNLPADNIGMVENLPASDTLKAGGFQGTNDFGKVGYGGPCPPSGTHRYIFKVYAVDSELALKARATKDELLKALEGHVVGQAQLMGIYKR